MDIAWLCPLSVRAFAVVKWMQLLLRKKRIAMKSRALAIDNEGFECVFECMGATNKLLQLQATIC